MKYARIVSNTAVDVRTESPEGCFHPDIATQFVTVPDQVEDGWTLNYGVWSAPVVPDPVIPDPVPVIPPKVSVIEYKMLFTSAERIATKYSTDPVIIDLQELMNDPRTTTVDLSLKSISDALDYMTELGILAVGRKSEILTGVVK